MTTNDGVLLTGLDGSSALAYLAAIGTLRTLSIALQRDDVKMNWIQHEGAWRPRIGVPLTDKEVISLLQASLNSKRSDHPTVFVSDTARISTFYESARHGTLPHAGLDAWIAALVSDVHPNATSQFQLTRRDYFAGNLDEIMASTTPASLHHSLFEVWRYDERLSGQSLHLEPSEDRRHAYQWNKPSGDPTRNKCGNVIGANRMAIEAIPFFLALPSKNPDRLLVTGWTGVRSDDSRWTWPIWNIPISLTVVPSVLALAELQEETPDSKKLSAIGILAAYRCRRIIVEQTPNLTPSFAIQ